MPLFDEDTPQKKGVHEIGEDLSPLSLADLEERIALLKREIKRIQEAFEAKRTGAAAADSVFKR